MRCQHCGAIGGEDDHRCLSCGRVMQGTVVAAPASYIAAPPAISPAVLFEQELSKASEKDPDSPRPIGRVAPPMRRVTAAAMDISMVILGFGVFAATARFVGSAFDPGDVLWIVLPASLTFIALFYGLLWAMARRETAGMHWTRMQLVRFDGSPLDDRNRAIRFASVWLSYCSGGLGLLWALADEENLTFHDRISETYPAVLVTQRR
jgi:uncharacterized RDD family membrane protein YckC